MTEPETPRAPEWTPGLVLYRLGQVEANLEAANEKLDAQAVKLALLEPLPGLLRWALGLLVPTFLGFAGSVILLIPK